MAGVKYIGPVLDCSGYSEAARNYVLALHAQGCPVTVAPISFEHTRPDLGEDGAILHSLINKAVDYDTVIVHSTPDLWPNLIQYERNVRKIGCTVWETSALHPTWTSSCNRMDEIWVPCEWNLEVFSSSGVKTPLFKVPHSINAPELSNIPKYNLPGVPDNFFVFYSIFQWQERKNPIGLVSAYSTAFSGVDDVVLILKTYVQDHANDLEQIKNNVALVRRSLNLQDYPKIMVLVNNLSSAQLWGLHSRGDCFVLLQRSEGWGLPHSEAAACAKPVITPAYGGQTEFLNKNNSYLVDYQLTPVANMPWSPYYSSSAWWCEPNMYQAVQFMRHVYNHRNEAAEKGLLARKDVLQLFSREAVGRMLLQRLQDGK